MCIRDRMMRGAEAAGVRHLVVEATRSAREALVVGGDFNDEANAVTTQIVADSSWRRDGRAPREYTLYNALDVEQRPAPVRSRDAAFTILHAGEPERIDHVLVSAHFAPHAGTAIGHVAAVEILADHLVERARVTRLGAAGDGIDLERIFSDHAAVCVSIVLAASG
jgi:endonuclease/exonuclease/phosphatase family metal-dependent hydrolase